MNTLKHYSKSLLISVGLLITVALAGCGGDQGREPILGIPAAALVSVAVTPATATTVIGAAQQFVATASFADGTSINVTTASSWASGTAAVATINATSGVGTGVSAGTSAITATYSGKSGTATLTVTPATLRSIAVTPVNPTVAIGMTQQLMATGTFSDGSSRDITSIASFTSAIPAVATVVASGGLTIGVTAGTAVMTASSDGILGSTTLTVTPATLVSIALTPTNPTVLVGATRQFTVIATYSDRTSVDVTSSSTYVSATPSVATVTANSGLSTGVAAGSSLITASFGNQKASTTVTVPAATLSSIAVTPANATVPVGAAQRFVATATYSDNSTADISNSATWTSGNTAVATVVPGGVATGVAAGTTAINATFGGKTSSGNLTVTAALTLSSIAVTPASPSILIGATQQYAATATYSDNSTADITNAVTWTSSNTLVATIDSTGRATGLTPGVVTITAAQGGKTGTATLTVTAVPVGATVNLGTAASFGVLAGTSITNNAGGTTLVAGDVGSPSQTVDPTQTAGFTNYKSGAILAGALADLQTAITDANSRTCDVNSAAAIDLGGLTLPPGVYCYAGAISITGTFTMTGPGLYIFRTSSTLNSTANSSVALVGGATAANVFWVPVAPTTLGANSVFKGTIMGKAAAITMGDNANLQNGRVLSGAAITLRNNLITK